ncbi:unnamed protein product [Phyllotreta striolata]|uniref:SH2 domain-containing protein n=1 Tax=Phyllotreta striolata TaxID=444603 RepID=A0A9N9XKT8_PHYSR|nr:unnamed protein product [Phyllotreta striolata]
MSLNKVLLLDEPSLLSLLKTNNHEDIAGIVQSKHLDGKQLLDLSEFQTISWKLSPAQNKRLFAFIRSIKEDPYILFKKQPINKPKPNLPVTQKPILPTRPLQVKQPLKPPQQLPTTNHEEIKPKPKMHLPPQATHKNETLGKSIRKPPAIAPETLDDVDYEDLENTYDKEPPNEEYLEPNDFNEEENEPENTYEPAPDDNRRARNISQTKPVSIATRAPIPIPRVEDDEPNQKMKNLKNNIRTIGGYLNIDVEETEAEINEELSQTGKKYTVNDLTNIIIVDEDESKRPVNFLGKINKFFTLKSKSTRANSSNYENHMLRSEMPGFELPESVRNRPLPDIPSTLNKKRDIITEKPRKRISLHRREPEDEPPLPVQDKGRRSPRSQPERPTEDKVINDIKRLQSIRNKSLVKVNKEDEDLLVYENRKPLKTSTSRQNSLSPLPILTDELAAQLSEKLKVRASAFIPAIQDTDDDQPVYNNIDDDSVKDEPEEDHQPIYGNVDDEEEEPEDTDNNVEDDNNEDEGEDDDNVEDEEEQEVYVDSIFNINNERFYRNTDRKGAKQLLRALPSGSFLFRPSERYFLVLTLKAENRFYNLGIERTSTNKIRLNADASSVSPEFGTLRAFVDYFKKEPVTFTHGNGLVEVCLNPSLPADLF